MAVHASHPLTPGARYTVTGQPCASANRTQTQQIISFRDLQIAFQDTAGLRARVRARMVAQGHTVEEFVVSTPTHLLKLASEGVDCRHARLTCSKCGEWAEIAIATKTVWYGDASQSHSQSPLTAARTALGTLRCGSALSSVRLPLIHLAKHLPVQLGAALARCQDMTARGHRMGQPAPARCPLYGGLIHRAACLDCGARLVVDANLRTLYGFHLVPGGEVIQSADVPSCSAHPVVEAQTGATTAPIDEANVTTVNTANSIETVETVELSRVPDSQEVA